MEVPRATLSLGPSYYVLSLALLLELTTPLPSLDPNPSPNPNQDEAQLDSVHEEDMHLRMGASVRLLF